MSAERDLDSQPLHNGNYQFGNNPYFNVHLLSIQGNVQHSQHLLLDRAPVVNDYTYSQGLLDIGQSVQIVEGPKGDDNEPSTVEIAVAHLGASDAHGYDAHISTGSSSIRNNTKQAAEHALRS